MLNLGHAPTNILLMLASKLSISEFTTNYNCTGDMNDLTSAGIFSGHNLKNAPGSDLWFTWINLLSNGNEHYCTQLGTYNQNTKLYIRCLNNGGWSAWRTI